MLPSYLLVKMCVVFFPLFYSLSALSGAISYTIWAITPVNMLNVISKSVLVSHVLFFPFIYLLFTCNHKLSVLCPRSLVLLYCRPTDSTITSFAFRRTYKFSFIYSLFLLCFILFIVDFPDNAISNFIIENHLSRLTR